MNTTLLFHTQHMVSVYITQPTTYETICAMQVVQTSLTVYDLI